MYDYCCILSPHEFHKVAISQGQLEGDFISPSPAELARKRSTPNKLKNIPKVKPSVEYTADSDGVIDLTLDDEEIILSSPVIKRKKGKEKATTISKVSGVTVEGTEDQSPFQRTKSSKNRHNERDSINFERITRQDRGSRSINGDKSSGTLESKASSIVSASANIDVSARSSTDVIDLCSDSDDADDMISTLFPDSNSTPTITINDIPSGNKDPTAVHDFIAARMSPDGRATPLSSTAESQSQLNDAVHLPMTSSIKLNDQPHETSNIASITLPGSSPTTSEDAFKAIDSDSLALMDIMDAKAVGDLLTRMEETSIDFTQSDTPFVLRVSTPLRTVISPPTTVQPEDIPSDSRHVRFATSPLHDLPELPEREDTPMDYVDWSPENLANSTTDTHTPTQQDDTQAMVQLGSKVSGSNQSNQSFDNSAPSSSASSMVTGSQSESSGPSFQFARKSTRATQLFQRQNSQNDSGSSMSRTPEPQVVSTPVTNLSILVQFSICRGLLLQTRLPEGVLLL